MSFNFETGCCRRLGKHFEITSINIYAGYPVAKPPEIRADRTDLEEHTTNIQIWAFYEKVLDTGRQRETFGTCSRTVKRIDNDVCAFGFPS